MGKLLGSETLFLYIKYSRLLMKSCFQYKLNTFLSPFTVFCRESLGIVIIYLTLKRFDNINGWHMNEMLFLFSLLFLTYSILILFFTGLRDFDHLVYSGEFDRFLLRPQGLLFQIIVSKVDYFASIGHGALGVLLFLKTAAAIGIQWNVRNTFYYFMAILGGVVIQASIFMIFSCSSFWLMKTENLRNFLFMNTRKFAGYPISVYPSFIQKFLLYIIPFAFVNFFPAQFFLRKPDMSQYWTGYIYMTPVVGFLMFVIAYYVWNFSLKYYSSAGN